MPVGDINSTERGSGARFNDGKPDLSLIPPRLLPIGNATHEKLTIGLNALMFHNETDRLEEWFYDQMSLHQDSCAKVFEYGKAKYAAWNWAKGMPWSIPLACALRHAHALWNRNEENDPESGLPHIGHILCNLVMVLHYLDNYPEGNDLPHKVLS